MIGYRGKKGKEIITRCSCLDLIRGGREEKVLIKTGKEGKVLLRELRMARFYQDR